MMNKRIHIDDQPEEIQHLLKKAIEASHIAYAPYSNYFVGAAILTSGGDIYLGANQENAAYPSCMCGERVGLYHYVMNSQQPIKYLALYAENRQEKDDQCAAPCGECRQVILEFQQRQKPLFAIYSINQKGYIQKWDSIHELLPNGFHGGVLLP